MESSKSSQSPERPNTVRVTYVGRMKRKRGSISCAEGLSDLDSNNAEAIPKKPTSFSSGHKRSLSSMPPPSSKGPKKIEVQLPGPSAQKRARRNSADPQDEAKDLSDKGSLHCRTLSISSVPREENSLGKIDKPILGSGKKKQPVMPDVDEDDNISVAESSSVRIRRTEPERIQYFTEHPECGNTEPHRVLCMKCDKWVNLGRQQTYAVRPWEMHREKCDKLARPQSPKTPISHEEEPDDDEDDAASTVAPSVSPSVSQSERSGRRTESERQRLLESDPRAEEVKPTEVLCKKCQKWIKLSSRRYALSNWNNHQRRCSGVLPSSRIATAERKLRIVNDSQAKVFSSRSVECAVCGTYVLLDGEGDYDLTKWEEHKGHCSSARVLQDSRLPSPNVTKPNRELFAASSTSINQGPEPASSTSIVRPPLSSASTDGTLIASSTSRQELKRSSEGIEEEVRPLKRPRDEKYEPTENAPGPFGWFLLPFRTFVRGFREGLQS